MKNYGEVLLHFCPAKSPIETMVCTSDSKKLIIGLSLPTLFDRRFLRLFDREGE